MTITPIDLTQRLAGKVAVITGGAKQSGLGRELGPDAALAFTDTKNVFFAS